MALFPPLLLLACNIPAGDTYRVTGTVLQVEQGKVVVDHDEIPGFMAAMVMPFPADPNLLRGLERGDLIEANLLVSTDRSQLIGIEVTGHEVLDDPTLNYSGTPPMRIGEVLPALELPATGGETLTVGADQGETTVLTFLYSTCPLPEYCPLLATKLLLLQEQIRGKGRIVAITLDPDTDTLAVLEAYGEGLGADPTLWRFARTELAQLKDLFDRIEMSRSVREGLVLHSLKLLILDPEGRLLHLEKDNGWDIATIAGKVDLAAGLSAATTAP